MTQEHVEDKRRPADPSMEGLLASIGGEETVDGIKEVIRTDGDDSVLFLPKGIFNREQVDVYRRMIIRRQIESTGRMDPAGIMLGDVVLSQSIDGKARNQLVEVLKSVIEATQDRMSGLSNSFIGRSRKQDV